MKSRPFPLLVATAGLVVAALLALTFERVYGQAQPPAISVLTREGRRTLPLTLVNQQEFVGLDDLAGLFSLSVQESLGAITVSYKGKTIVVTPEQTLASVAGRLISPGWHEVGRFLGPSIRSFHAAFPQAALTAMWRDAGLVDVRSRRLSLGGGVVMWGRRDG